MNDFEARETRQPDSDQVPAEVARYEETCSPGSVREAIEMVAQDVADMPLSELTIDQAAARTFANRGPYSHFARDYFYGD